MKAPPDFVVNQGHLVLERKGTEVRDDSFTSAVSYIHAAFLQLSPSLLLSLAFARHHEPGSVPGLVGTVD